MAKGHTKKGHFLLLTITIRNKSLNLTIAEEVITPSIVRRVIKSTGHNYCAKDVHKNILRRSAAFVKFL